MEPGTRARLSCSFTRARSAFAALALSGGATLAPGILQAAQPSDPGSAQTGEGEATGPDLLAPPERFVEEPGRTVRGRKAHTLRTFTSMGLVLGVFSLGYWLSRRDKMAGWNYLDLGERLDKEAWRFDTNSLVVNYFLHPFSGGVSYAAARADHHGTVASAGFSVLSSFLWESVFEYRAKVSLNDMIVTPLGGIPIGEFMHKLGVYLDTAPRNDVGTRIAQWTLGPLIQIDRRLDGAGHVAPRERDALGMTRAIWHHFHLESDVSAALESGRLAQQPGEYARAGVSMRGRLVSLPGYLRDGRFSRGFYKIDLTSLELGTEASKHGLGFRAASDSLLAGHHTQAVRSAGAGRRAAALTTGVSLAFSYLDSRASSFREQLGALHLPGPAIDGHLERGSLRVSARVRVHPDFVGVSGLPYDQWAAAHRGERAKHILRNMGYFYAWGGSGSVAAELAFGPLRAQGDAFYGRYRSQEGLSKWQERVTNDVPAGTGLLVFRGSAGMALAELPLTLGVSGTLRRWDSWVGEFGGRAQTGTFGVQLAADF